MEMVPGRDTEVASVEYYLYTLPSVFCAKGCYSYKGMSVFMHVYMFVPVSLMDKDTCVDLLFKVMFSSDLQ